LGVKLKSSFTGPKNISLIFTQSSTDLDASNVSVSLLDVQVHVEQKQGINEDGIFI